MRGAERERDNKVNVEFIFSHYFGRADKVRILLLPYPKNIYKYLWVISLNIVRYLTH